jgi:hypothetical protein
LVKNRCEAIYQAPKQNQKPKQTKVIKIHIL